MRGAGRSASSGSRSWRSARFCTTRSATRCCIRRPARTTTTTPRHAFGHLCPGCNPASRFSSCSKDSGALGWGHPQSSCRPARRACQLTRAGGSVVRQHTHTQQLILSISAQARWRLGGPPANPHAAAHLEHISSRALEARWSASKPTRSSSSCAKKATTLACCRHVARTQILDPKPLHNLKP